jgi:carbon storage regulator
MIDDNIEILVVDIRGDKVRLGVTAPKNVAVHRKEIFEAIKRENDLLREENERLKNEANLEEPMKQ